MDFLFNSTASVYGEVIDGRALSFLFEYYDLSTEQAVNLLEDIVVWLSKLFDKEFVSICKIISRALTDKTLADAKSRICTGQGVSLTQESFAKSSVVYNRKTMDSYLRRFLINPPETHPFVSADYPSVWSSLFHHNVKDPIQIKGKLLDLFFEEKRHLATKYCSSDAQVLFTVVPYERFSSKFHGVFALHLSAFGLGSHIVHAADTFIKQAEHLSDQYLNINARIALQPVDMVGKSPHMRYFGQCNQYDGSYKGTGCTKHEWYRTYYVPGSEWYNILSPRTQQHISAKKQLDETRISKTRLSGGGLVVRSAKGILDYDVWDALEIKQYLYPALFPGNSCVPLKMLLGNNPDKFMFDVFPRCGWEIVPILHNEISIVGSSLVFAHVVSD